MKFLRLRQWLRKLRLYLRIQRAKWLCAHRKPIRVHGVRVNSHLIPSERIRKTLFDNSYERDEMRQMQAELRPDDRLLELGGGMGVVACAASQMLPSGRVLSYEANPAMARIASEHVALNAADGVEIQPGILDHAAGSQRFFVAPDFWESSLLPQPGWQAITVEAFPLEETLRAFAPTVVMMDIEGGEYGLLATNAWTACPTLRSIIVEFHRIDNVSQVLAALPIFQDGHWAVDAPLGQITERLTRRNSITLHFRRRGTP